EADLRDLQALTAELSFLETHPYLLSDDYFYFAPSSRVISIIVRRNPARANRRCAVLFPSAVESTTRGAPLASRTSNVPSSNARPPPARRWPGPPTMSYNTPAGPRSDM